GRHRQAEPSHSARDENRDTPPRRASATSLKREKQAELTRAERTRATCCLPLHGTSGKRAPCSIERVRGRAERTAATSQATPQRRRRELSKPEAWARARPEPAARARVRAGVYIP